MKSQISSEFGMRTHPIKKKEKMHSGTDIVGKGTDINGTSALAVKGGLVSKVDNQPDGVGNYLTIDHGDGTDSSIFHLWAPDVQQGDYVNRGDSVGAVGSTGSSSGPHIHQRYRIDYVKVDPEKYTDK